MGLCDTGRLRAALSRKPPGWKPPKPSAAPPMTLEALLKRKQDSFRPPAPPSLLDRIRNWIQDW